MGHSGHGINMYGVLMILMDNLVQGDILSGDFQSYYTGMNRDDNTNDRDKLVP